MRLLQSLSQHLMTTTGLPRENFESFAERGELHPLFIDHGQGIQVARFRYDGVINIESYSGDGMTLLALVTSWLSEHDGERHDIELPDPEVNVQLNDRHTADVDITIVFDEPVNLVRDDNGPVMYDGVRWSVAESPVDVAEDLDGFEGDSDVV